jgi:DNA-binding transcriptional ArsR family regulator
MGILTAALLALVGDEANRKVLETVAQKRTPRFKDLEESLDLDREEIRESLDALEKAGLVKSQEAPRNVEDFRTFYASAAGLRAEQELRRLQLT